MASLAVILLAAERAEDHQPQTPAERRRPASRTLAGKKARHTHKIHGPLKASLKLVGKQPTKPSTPFVLQGTLQTDHDLDHVSFRWNLPKQVQVLSGELEGELTHLKKGKPETIEITLSSNTSEPFQIHFSGSAGLKNAHFGDVAQFPFSAQSEQEITNGWFKTSSELSQPRKMKKSEKKILD